MGIAGEQVGVPGGGLGGYDPYGDGLGAGGAGREGGDVYDF